jgi:minor extracellular protease Epr
MGNLGERVCRCAVRGKAKHAQRGIIVIRDRNAYDDCVMRLRQAGVTPVKSIASRGLLCLHVNGSREWRRLTSHPAVQYAELDVQVRAHAAGCSGYRRKRPRRQAGGSRAKPALRAPWNVTRVQAPLLWPSTLGGGVRIAVLDTGIGPHPNLRVAGGVNTIGGRSYRDDNGHGTHVAGIAAGLGRCGNPAGVAPRARLYAVKVLDSSGSGYISDIVEGIEWCIKRGIRVMNMSFGLPPGLTSRALQGAIRRAARRGIVAVASAGNGGRNSGGLDVPASYPETIAVAASTRRNRVAAFSSRGNGIAVAAPGQAIRSTKPGGGYRIESGTSMAAPHAAGGAALLLSIDPRLTPAALKRRLDAAAKRLGYRRTAQGAGLLQLRAAAASSARKQ